MKKFFLSSLIAISLSANFAYANDFMDPHSISMESIPWRLTVNNHYKMTVETSLNLSVTLLFYLNETIDNDVSDPIYIATSREHTTLYPGSSTIIKSIKGDEIHIQISNPHHGAAGFYQIISTE